MPMATGTAKAKAHSELSTVTMKRSRMPNFRWLPSVVSNCALVKKFAWLASSDGMAWMSRNIAISRIAITMVEPAVAASNSNSRSPRRAAAPSRAVSADVARVRSGDGVGGPCAIQLTRWH